MGHSARPRRPYRICYADSAVRTAFLTPDCVKPARTGDNGHKLHVIDRMPPTSGTHTFRVHYFMGALMSEIAAETPRATRPDKKPRPPGAQKKFRDRYESRAYSLHSIALNSTSARKVYDRVFERVDGAFFGVAVLARITLGEDGATYVEEIADADMASAAKDIADERARLQILADENAVTITVRYTKPATLEAKISAPRTSKFLALIRDLDALIAAIDALWLAGVVNDKQHSQGIYLWQRRVLRAASQVIMLAGRAFRAARRGGRLTDDGEVVTATNALPEPDASEAAFETAIADTAVSDGAHVNGDASTGDELAAVTEEAAAADDGMKPAKTRRRRAAADAAQP